MRRNNKFKPRLIVVKYAGNSKENAARLKEARRYLIDCMERRFKTEVTR